MGSYQNTFPILAKIVPFDKIGDFSVVSKQVDWKSRLLNRVSVQSA